MSKAKKPLAKLKMHYEKLGRPQKHIAWNSYALPPPKQYNNV